jgi:hypothetical protein
MKKGFLEVLQVLAFSAFIGIAGYGILIYWGGEAQEKIPVSSSLLLGLGAVTCIVVIVLTGGVLDKIAAADDAGNQTETGIDG